MLSEGDGDTFAERAEWYYQKRPQLLALLQELYNGYTTLLDRCNRMQGKGNLSSHSSSMLVIDQDTLLDQEAEWDAESSLSYQQSPPVGIKSGTFFVNGDDLVADLVMKNVEKDILLDLERETEQQCHESWRKIELLKKLLEVLESERMVLLNENRRLDFKVQALTAENKGLSCKVTFLKRKAGELARCVLKMREDRRVYMLTRKIEGLQEHIYVLESRNKEYHQQLVMKADQPEKEEKSMKKENVGASGYLQMALLGCFQVEKLESNESNEAESYSNTDVKTCRAKRVQKWWARMKNMDVFKCGLQHSH